MSSEARRWGAALVALVAFVAFMLVVGNLLADIALAWLDPRIRYD